MTSESLTIRDSSSWTNDPTRIARGNYIIRDVLSHHGTSSNHRATSDSHARQNKRPRPNEGVLANGNFGDGQRHRLIAKIMSGAAQVNFLGHGRSGADFYLA